MDQSVIYITGYGRSGSTLLDVLLGNHPDVFGAGELTWLFRAAKQRAECSCGMTVDACPFWHEVLAETLGDIPGLTLSGAHRLTLQAERLLGSNRELKQYQAIWRRVFQAIRRVSGKSIIVDSSKNNRIGFRRLRLLKESLTATFYPLHLVRDPRAVMWSLGRGTNSNLEAGRGKPSNGGMFRGLASWAFSNLAIEWQRRNSTTRFERLRYEDLTQNPELVLRHLGQYLGLDLQPVASSIAAGDDFDAGHGVAGNRMRRSGAIRLRSDSEWAVKMPRYARACASIVWPLTRAYRYTGPEASDSARQTTSMP